jgi:hypothetical protein
MQSIEEKYILFANARYRVGHSSSSCAMLCCASATCKNVCVLFLPGENKEQ